MRALFVLLAGLALTVSAGCARHGVAGESCAAPGLEDPNAIGQCAAGFVCAPDRSSQTGSGQTAHWDVSTCRAECSDNTDCTVAGQTCRAVVGAEYRMACQPN